MKVILRGEKSTFWAYLLWLLSIVILIASTIHGGWRELLFAVPLGALLSFVGWAGWWQPRLIVVPQGIHVVNPMREFLIPWSDIDEILNRWGLYIHTRSGKKISVWCLPTRVGLMYNSWRERKRTMPEIIDWENTEPRDSMVPLPFAVDSLNQRLHNIRSNSRLRRELAQATPQWESTTVRNILFLPIGVTIVLFVITVATFIR